MNSRMDIICQNLCVEFPIFDTIARSVKAQIGGHSGGIRTFKALNGVDVAISKGERVGLLGHNGAGKSTFLRTLAGVYPPNSGVLKVNSITTSLFELAVGTDPDASGYENIPLLMASRGISQSRLNEVVADVEIFTELGDALARPLRTYSRGMHLRIAFAVATFHAEGVLLMDEVVGAGDAQFAEKSKARIKRLMGEAGTLLLASHVQPLLQTHCERGLIFEGGRIVFDGDIQDAVESLNNMKSKK